MKCKVLLTRRNRKGSCELFLFHGWLVIFIYETTLLM